MELENEIIKSIVILCVEIQTNGFFRNTLKMLEKNNRK